MGSAAAFAESLALPIRDLALLEQALVHSSWLHEHPERGGGHNERLEFLGDAVLGLVVTDTLYRVHPGLSEGRLAKLRAAVVNARALAEVARTIGLGEHVRLGRGEEATGGRDKSSILSDTVEAVIGAVYLSDGFAAASEVVHLLFDPLMEAAAGLGAGLDWKTSLQELGAALGLGAPAYVVEDDGPDHAKTFTAAVLLGGTVHGRGTGRTKKAAEQEAAETAWRALSVED